MLEDKTGHHIVVGHLVYHLEYIPFFENVRIDYG
jgi:hypothetical protein